MTRDKNTMRTTCWQLALIVAVAVLAYANTFGGPFVFDDIRNIVENPALRDLGNFLDLTRLSSVSGSSTPLQHIFKTRYVGYLSLALNYYVHGLSVWGYHFVNLCIHVANGLLVYALARVLFLPMAREPRPIAPETARAALPFAPLLAALLFVSHPIQTQAVTYVVQRMTSLATMFLLAAFLLYLLARRTPQQIVSRLLLGLSLATAALGSLTKEFVLFLPLFLLLWEILFSDDSPRMKLRRLWPFAGIPLLPILMVYGPHLLRGEVSGMGKLLTEATAIPAFTSLEYFFIQMRVILTYLRLLLWPTGQNLDYDFPLAPGLPNPGVLVGLLVVAALAALAYALRRKARAAAAERRHELLLLAFSLWAFLLALMPESSFFPIADVIFEHRLYAPSVWFFIFLALLVQAAVRRSCVNPGRRLACPALVCCLLIVPLASATFLRNQIWQDQLTLWRDVVAKSPQKARPRQNLAKALNDAGQFREALTELQKGLAYTPHDLSLLRTLSDTYRGLKRPDLAIRTNQTALEVAPNDVLILSNLGMLYGEINRYDLAAQSLTKAAALTPGRADIHFNLGYVHKMQGQTQQAEKSYLQALQLQPTNAEAHYNLALLYSELNQPDKAMFHYERTIDCKPDFISAYNNLAVLLVKHQRPAEAIQWLTRALQIAPDNPSLRRHLALLTHK